VCYDISLLFLLKLQQFFEKNEGLYIPEKILKILKGDVKNMYMSQFPEDYSSI